MFGLAMIPFFSFLLSAVTANSCTNTTTVPCPLVDAFIKELLNEITFRFYPGKTMDEYVDFSVNDSAKCAELLDPGKNRTVIYSPGWGRHDNTPNNITRTAVITTLLRSGNCNVIEMNWNSISCNPLYTWVVKYLCVVGQVLAKFINGLLKYGHSFLEFVLLGHSLGAHIIGHAGRFADYCLPNIRALDPAGPFIGEYNSLDKDCAQHVEVIHTDSCGFGTTKPLGHVDFYPDGGKCPQPGCNMITAIGCSHNRAPMLFASSVENPDLFTGVKCPSSDDWMNGKCNSNQMAHMGYWADSDAFGTYYLRTNELPPYGCGETCTTYAPSSSSSDLSSCPVVSTILSPLSSPFVLPLAPVFG